jgi:hypothetical protein
VHECAADLHAVARTQVFNTRPTVDDADARVLAGHQGVLECYLTARTSADDRIAQRQIDLLQQETEPEASHAVRSAPEENADRLG